MIPSIKNMLKSAHKQHQRGGNSLSRTFILAMMFIAHAQAAADPLDTSQGGGSPSSDSDSRPNRPTSVGLEEGDRVVIHGLQSSESRHNGENGILISFNPKKDVWQVKLQTKDNDLKTSILCKPNNLKLYLHHWFYKLLHKDWSDRLHGRGANRKLICTHRCCKLSDESLRIWGKYYGYHPADVEHFLKEKKQQDSGKPDPEATFDIKVETLRCLMSTAKCFKQAPRLSEDHCRQVIDNLPKEMYWQRHVGPISRGPARGAPEASPLLLQAITEALHKLGYVDPFMFKAPGFLYEHVDKPQVLELSFPLVCRKQGLTLAEVCKLVVENLKHPQTKPEEIKPLALFYFDHVRSQSAWDAHIDHWIKWFEETRKTPAWKKTVPKDESDFYTLLLSELSTVKES